MSDLYRRFKPSAASPAHAGQGNAWTTAGGAFGAAPKAPLTLTKGHGFALLLDISDSRRKRPGFRLCKRVLNAAVPKQSPHEHCEKY